MWIRYRRVACLNLDSAPMSEKQYFSHVREDLIRNIPKGVNRILEVGCGDGSTSVAIKREFGDDIEITGIEFSEQAGRVAQEKLHQVLIGNVETLEFPFEPGYFDCILYGDVLEHLVDPWQALKKHTHYLNDKGCVVASIPNIAYFKIIAMLKKDLWRYEEAGIMDRTHLRFFTMKTMNELFEQAGLSAQVVEKRFGGTSFYRKLGFHKSNKYVQQFIFRATKR